MNELAAYQQTALPVKPADLARFILIAPEKLKALKAEIRAIEKAQLAEAVRQQKREEQRRLCELIVLADARMGEITRAMPTAQGARKDLELLPSSGKKSKAQAIKELRLSTSQVHRMEQMAAHPDIVEGVVAESRAGQTEATQSEVLRRIKEREKVIDLTEVRQSALQAELDQIDRDFDNLKRFQKVTCFVGGLYEITDEMLDSVIAADDDLDRTIKDLEEAARLLVIVKNKLQERRVKRGKKAPH